MFQYVQVLLSLIEVRQTMVSTIMHTLTHAPAVFRSVLVRSQIDTSLSQLDPDQRLFTTVFKWQKAEKKFMDGAFLELNAEDTQAEVCV